MFDTHGVSTDKKKHPNRVPFEGVLTRLDKPSDKSPNGARGHRVILTTDAATEALSSLEGMAVAFTADWEKHDPRRKCGVITGATIKGDELRVSGHLFCHDFPEISEYLAKPGVEMGMSYELVDAHVKDMRAQVWTLTRVTFTGAAILLRTKAAYRDTRFKLQAGEEEFTGAIAIESVVTLRTGRAGRSSKHC